MKKKNTPSLQLNAKTVFNFKKKQATSNSFCSTAQTGDTNTTTTITMTTSVIML